MENFKQSKKTILVTEDEDSNFQLLEVLLEIWGVNAMRARTGQEAIDLCQQNNKIECQKPQKKQTSLFQK